MKWFEGHGTMRHAAGKKHNASGETKKQLKWLVAMVAAVATLLSGGGGGDCLGKSQRPESFRQLVAISR